MQLIDLAGLSANCYSHIWLNLNLFLALLCFCQSGAIGSVARPPWGRAMAPI